MVKKCAYCGRDLDGKPFCRRCGRRVEVQHDELEVEYTEFPVSELLEIRAKPGKSRAEGENKRPVKRRAGGKLLSKLLRLFRKDDGRQ